MVAAHYMQYQARRAIQTMQGRLATTPAVLFSLSGRLEMSFVAIQAVNALFNVMQTFIARFLRIRL